MYRVYLRTHTLTLLSRRAYMRYTTCTCVCVSVCLFIARSFHRLLINIYARAFTSPSVRPSIGPIRVTVVHRLWRHHTQPVPRAYTSSCCRLQFCCFFFSHSRTRIFLRVRRPDIRPRRSNRIENRTQLFARRKLHAHHRQNAVNRLLRVLASGLKNINQIELPSCTRDHRVNSLYIKLRENKIKNSRSSYWRLVCYA